MKQIVFRHYALDQKENQMFAERWLEISLEDSVETLKVIYCIIGKVVGYLMLFRFWVTR